MVTLGLAAAFRGDSKEWRMRVVSRALWAVVTLVVPVVGLVLVTEFTSFQVLERFSDFFTDPSTTVRTRIMTDALLQFNESPVFGSSTVEYHERFYPHNILVESLMVGGIPCFAALAAYLVSAASAGVRIYQQLPERRWLVLLFVQYVIDSMLSGSLYSNATFWVTSLIVINGAQQSLGLTRTGIKFGGAATEAP